jgi:peptide subunit release factor 1 (eRF1)
VIDSAGVARLLSVRDPEHGVVSVYLHLPLDPGQRRGLLAHAEDLLAQACHTGLSDQAAARARRCEVAAIRQAVAAHAHRWPGRSVAIFACAPRGLAQAIPLREQVAERAVIGPRPYVRPLLAELHRNPCYLAVVVDRRHGWLFWVRGEEATPAGHLESQTVGSKRFAGWHGLAAYRREQRARKLARQHYAACASAAAAAVAAGGCGPIVVGGHEAETGEFVRALPPALRERVAGTFVIDPHTMTPARVRQLAGQVVGRWQQDREQRLAASLAEQGPAGMTAVGLGACLAAASQHAIQVLLVPDEEVRPGFQCGRCGALTLAAGDCPDCGAATGPVADVIEELAVKVTEDGGSVWPVRGNGAPWGVAARRRFPAPV